MAATIYLHFTGIVEAWMYTICMSILSINSCHFCFVWYWLMALCETKQNGTVLCEMVFAKWLTIMAQFWIISDDGLQWAHFYLNRHFNTADFSLVYMWCSLVLKPYCILRVLHTKKSLLMLSLKLLHSLCWALHKSQQQQQQQQQRKHLHGCLLSACFSHLIHVSTCTSDSRGWVSSKTSHSLSDMKAESSLPSLSLMDSTLERKFIFQRCFSHSI